MSLRSKCDRALAAYLKSQNVAPNCLPSNYSGIRTLADGPIVTCKTGLVPEVPFSGRYQATVEISIRGNAAVQPDESDPEIRRKELDDVVEKVYVAMAQSDDNGQTLKATAAAITAAGRALAVDASNGADPAETQRAANNADMAAFTFTDWYEGGMDGGNPRNEAGGADSTIWMEILSFSGVACNSNVD